MEAKTPKEFLKTYELFDYQEGGLDETHIYLHNAELAMQEYADQQCKAKDEENSRLKNELLFNATTVLPEKDAEYERLKKKADELAKALEEMIPYVEEANYEVPDIEMDLKSAKKALESHKSNTPQEQPESREVAIEFAEWCQKNNWYFNTYSDGKWNNNINTHYQTITTDQLFDLFNQRKK